MKIQIEYRTPDQVQEFFSAPLSLAQRITVKKRLIFERALEQMEALGLKPRHPRRK